MPEYKKELEKFNKLAKVPKKSKPKYSLRKHCQLVWTQYGSKYYRYKDMLDRGDKQTGIVSCCSCSSEKHWKDFQAGHFVPRNHLEAWFADNNVHNQCFACNMMKSGNLFFYEDFMLDKYGEAEVKRLKDLRFKQRELTHEKLEELREFFRGELKKWGVI